MNVDSLSGASGGFEAVWIEIDQITPPVGLNLSVLSSLTNNELSLGRVGRATILYWVMHLIVIALRTTFPVIALYLHNLLF